MIEDELASEPGKTFAPFLDGSQSLD